MVSNGTVMKRQIAIEIICFLFIVLFVYAAVNKILAFQKFTVQIGQSPLLTGFGNFIPALVIFLELGTSALIALPGARIFGLYAAFSLITMFTAYIIAILNFSSFIPCSCGGVLEKLKWTDHLIFNFAFLLLAFVALMLYPRHDSLKRNNSSIE